METTDLFTLSWPPDVTVKKHPRAKHIKLKASVKHGLELIVPKRFNHKQIPFILEENRSWIEKQLFKIQTPEQDILPNEIGFLGLQKKWTLEYIETTVKKITIITRPHNELVLTGDINNRNSCKKLLIHWMKLQARSYLIEELDRISQEIKLPYNRVIIRDQTSRWGSCSSDKDISLNYKLIFLPPILIKHIFIHELCHTVHLNHSEKFWLLVEKFDPDWKIHRKELRKADKFIPRWIISFSA